MELSILSERRVYQPYGLEGGEAGQVGTNVLYRGDSGRKLNLGGKNNLRVVSGDRICITTPGGGAYGAKEDV